MHSARASHSFWLITLRLSKSATFLGSEMRFIASTPESMRHTPRLSASMGQSAE